MWSSLDWSQAQGVPTKTWASNSHKVLLLSRTQQSDTPLLCLAKFSSEMHSELSCSCWGCLPPSALLKLVCFQHLPRVHHFFDAFSGSINRLWALCDGAQWFMATADLTGYLTADSTKKWEFPHLTLPTSSHTIQVN